MQSLWEVSVPRLQLVDPVCQLPRIRMCNLQDDCLVFRLRLMGMRNQCFQTLGATGVIAMKMINNTKRMSIMGVTLISEDTSLLPVENAMRPSFPSASFPDRPLIACRRQPDSR
jgi:hypothetical protein